MSRSKEFSVGLFDKEPFTATATKSNVTVEVGEDTSLLQALLDAGVPMKYSCEGGTCGSCVVPLVSGEVEYENEYLEEDEHGTRIACCVDRGVGHIEVEA